MPIHVFTASEWKSQAIIFAVGIGVVVAACVALCFLFPQFTGRDQRRRQAQRRQQQRDVTELDTFDRTDTADRFDTKDTFDTTDATDTTDTTSLLQRPRAARLSDGSTRKLFRASGKKPEDV